MAHATLNRSQAARLVTRILDQPELVNVIRGLDAPVLRKLIEHVGLEDMGEIVSLATPEQLERIFDDDLWRSRRPGQDESFDAARFGLWLDVLVQTGEATALEKILAMDEELLALGLSRLVYVIDIDALAAEMAEGHTDEDDLLEKALESSLYEELEEFRVIARDPMRWDAVISILTALDKDHHHLLRRLLERICAVTTETVEENGGLYDVLTSDEMLESDVAFEREQRREREGFVAPSAAASFLRHARVTPLAELVGARGPDPITKAHFRASPRPVAPPPASPKVQELLRELGASGVLDAAARRRPKLERSAGADPMLVERGMRALRAEDPRTFATRVEELAYLVNVLVGVSGSGDDALRPAEAAEVTTRVCTLGLATLLRELGGRDADDARLAATLREHDLVKTFRIGWHLVGDEAWSADGLHATAERARRATSR